MTVEQKKAYLEAHKIPYIVKPNGELQFDFMKIYTNPEEIQTVAPARLGADLAAAAVECDEEFPEPTSYKPDAYTLVRWGAIPDDDQQQTLYQTYIISDDFAETISPGEPLCVRTTTIEGRPFAFFYIRSPLTDPEQLKQNGGRGCQEGCVNGVNHHDCNLPAAAQQRADCAQLGSLPSNRIAS